MSSWYGRRKDDPDARWNRRMSTPAKKDKRRWCRGKVGVEHVTEIVEDRWAGRGCRGYDIGKWVRYDDRKEWVIVDQGWMCCHIEQCVNCGKKMRHIPREQCPDRPLTRAI